MSERKPQRGRIKGEPTSLRFFCFRMAKRKRAIALSLLGDMLRDSCIDWGLASGVSLRFNQRGLKRVVAWLCSRSEAAGSVCLRRSRVHELSSDSPEADVQQSVVWIFSYIHGNQSCSFGGEIVDGRIKYVTWTGRDSDGGVDDKLKDVRR